ncbi:hypothetical protein KR026_006172, partial [Drosophila bipectinata]
MRQYFEQQNASREAEPLEYWKSNKTQFSSLAHCALEYFCVPATSCESERTF